MKEVATVRVIEYQKDQRLECYHEDHHFELERDKECHNDWYMIVTYIDGEKACEGWIDDSNSIGILNAMTQACDGACLGHPEQWPEELTIN